MQTLGVVINVYWTFKECASAQTGPSPPCMKLPHPFKLIVPHPQVSILRIASVTFDVLATYYARLRTNPTVTAVDLSDEIENDVFPALDNLHDVILELGRWVRTCFGEEVWWPVCAIWRVCCIIKNDCKIFSSQKDVWKKTTVLEKMHWNWKKKFQRKILWRIFFTDPKIACAYTKNWY